MHWNVWTNVGQDEGGEAEERDGRNSTMNEKILLISTSQLLVIAGYLHNLTEKNTKFKSIEANWAQKPKRKNV